MQWMKEPRFVVEQSVKVIIALWISLMHKILTYLIMIHHFNLKFIQI